SDRVAAVGVVTATMPDVHCTPAHPVPITFINGTDDPLVDDDGSDPDWRGTTELLCSDRSREKWAAMNGCIGERVVENLDRVADGTSIMKTTHARCPAASDVVLFKVKGGGHTCPSGVQYLPEAVIGKTSRDIDAT